MNVVYCIMVSVDFRGGAMKRYIKAGSLSDAPYTLDVKITVDVEYEDDARIAAAEYFWPHSIKWNDPKNHRLIISDGMKDMLSTVVENTMYNLDMFGFDVISSQQQGYYSWYTTFTPITESGDVLSDVLMRIRISNHFGHGFDKNKDKKIKRIFVRSFMIGDMSYDSAFNAINAIYDLCEALYHGDKDAVLMFMPEYRF